MAKSKQTFSMQIEVPVYLISDAAERVAYNLDEYIGDPSEYFAVTTSKVLKALKSSESFKNVVIASLTDYLEDSMHSCEWYDLEVDAVIKELFPNELNAAVAEVEEARERAKRAALQEIEQRKLATKSKRLNIFVPKTSKGFTVELAALLEKYDGKMFEDLE